MSFCLSSTLVSICSQKNQPPWKMNSSSTRVLWLVDKALQSENGHLDLFLRFLLGLSLETNQKLLRGLLVERKKGSSSRTNHGTVRYIREKMRGDLSPESSINLFHCLNELKCRSLVEKIHQSLTSGSLSRESLSPAHFSALVFILQSSEEDVFDLKKILCFRCGPSEAAASI